MSSLFSLLDLGAGAMQAQQAGIAVSARNSSNVNTEGYSRERVDLRANRGYPNVSGVRAGDAMRHTDSFLSRRIRDNSGTLSLSRAVSEALWDLQNVTTGEQDVVGKMGGFFAALEEAAGAPTSSLHRESMLIAARDLAESFQAHHESVERARQESNQRIRRTVSEVNTLMNSIAKTNKAMQVSNDPVLADERDLAATRLAELVGGEARVDPDGHMRFTLPGGAVLVDGDKAAQLEAVPDAVTGDYRLEAVDRGVRKDISSQIESGEVGGYFQLRDQELPAQLADLDQLAFDLATNVNAVHRANAAADGSTGRDLFVEPTAVAGAAAAMALDAAVAADSSLVALAGAGTGPGDNAGGLALIDLGNQALAGGGTRTFLEGGVALGTSLGEVAQRAESDYTFFETVDRHLGDLRDSVSGVSVEEELQNLSRYQHGVEAALRFTQTVDSLLGDIISAL